MKFHIPSSKFALAYKFIIILGCIAMGVGLSGYVYKGSFMRYSGDDYCYGSVLTKHGLLGAQAYSYNNPVPFHGNRYSLTLFSSIVGLFKPSMNGVLPGLAIALWIVGLFFLFNSSLKKSHLHLSNLEILLISEFIVFITLYAAPDLPESLYWRSGMLPYLAPMIMNVFLAGSVLRYKPHTRSSTLLLGLIFLLAFVSGGFSETATGYQAGVLSLWFLCTFFAQKVSFAFNKVLRVPLAFAILGTMMAIILLIASPTIASELSESGLTQNVFNSSLLTLRYAWDFIYDSLQSVPLPHLIILAFFAALSFLIASRSDRWGSLNIKRVFLYGGLILIASYLLIACCIAPAAFVRSVKPNPRGLITTRFLMVVAFALIGWVVGQTFSRLLSGKRRMLPFLCVGSLLALTLVSLYPLRAARNTYSETRHFQKWARLWDIRDSNIREAKSQGVQDVEVMHLDKVIKWVGELSGNPGFWYNRCAAGYYGVESISATISVWDE